MNDTQKVNYAAEVFLDFMGRAADGKDDDDLVFAEAEIFALADAAGVDRESLGEIEVMTAGELRRRVRAGKASLARDDGP